MNIDMVRAIIRTTSLNTTTPPMGMHIPSIICPILSSIGSRKGENTIPNAFFEIWEDLRENDHNRLIETQFQ